MENANLETQMKFPQKKQTENHEQNKECLPNKEENNDFKFKIKQFIDGVHQNSFSCKN